MKVEVAKTAGFCFGVKHAVQKAYEQAGNGHVVTFGPIIHNEEVVGDLERKGVGVIETVDDIMNMQAGTVIIRSHGVSKHIYDVIEKQGLKLVDATCPFVLKIHKIVENSSKTGRSIIIVGNENHPEVQGIKGWSETPVYIIDSVESALNFKAGNEEKFTVVSQTTFNYKKFQEIVEILTQKKYNMNISNTICNATKERQTEAKVLAGVVDTMIVIGGRTSSNTRKLYEICKDICPRTYYVQTSEDLQQCDFSTSNHIGITAGASTPNNIIEEVQTNVRFI